jgi:hypothetical protein
VSVSFRITQAHNDAYINKHMHRYIHVHKQSSTGIYTDKHTDTHIVTRHNTRGWRLESVQFDVTMFASSLRFDVRLSRQGKWWGKQAPTASSATKLIKLANIVGSAKSSDTREPRRFANNISKHSDSCRLASARQLCASPTVLSTVM